MLYQPSNISPDEVIGSGTVDLSEGLTVSWRVNGDSAMTAYQITIYDNTAASTQLYTTGKQSLSTPFWGVNYAGETQYYTATIAASALSSAGVTNGGTYKLLITQWWSSNDSITQTTASVFDGMATPTVSIDDIPAPLTQRYYTFTGAYTQAQGDALKWVRWEIAAENSDGEIEDAFYDTGYIYGTGDLQAFYDGFVTGNTYDIRLTVETASGQQATTGWVQFAASYSLPETSATATATLTGQGYVLVSWSVMELAQGYSIYRRDTSTQTQLRLADVPPTVGILRDYAALSGKTYEYYIWPTGEKSYLAEPAITNQVTVCRSYWAIITAEESDDADKYTATGMYLFRYGFDGVDTGSISNNNSPNLLQNFTKYPTRQTSEANYLSGSVSGLIGSFNTSREYSDTVSQADALRALSTTSDELFLLDPKGYFIRIHTSDAIEIKIDSTKRQMPQTLTVPWVEVGSTENISVSVTPEGTLWPSDAVVTTTLGIDLTTGALLWTTSDSYDYGSILSLENGALIQTTDEDFNAATMALDQSTGEVTATVSTQ